MTKYIVISLLAGVAWGYFFVDPTSACQFEFISEWALILLLFTVGIELGLNKQLGKQVSTLPKVTLVVPFVIAGASIISGILVTPLIGLHPLEGAAVASGFGWYSLSGLLIAQSYDTALGTLAFISNVIRELIAIITIPVVARYFGHLSAVAPGGATAMDVTLPIISRNTNAQTTIAAVYSGTVLSLLVPLIVPLFIKWIQLFS